MIKSQILSTTIRLSGGGDREEERKETPKPFLGTSRPRNTINRYYDSLSNRLAYGRIKEAVLSSEKLVKGSATYAPSVLSGALAVLLRPDRSGLSLLSIYILTLLGTSVGFDTFLYFITVGYGTGIGIPVAVSLFFNTKSLDLATALHATLVVIWSFRMVTFLIWREYINWPALHKKLSQVNKQQSPDTMVKILCWMFYSLAYFCVASPCWFSIQSTQQSRGAISWIGILLQISGLVLESVADGQKSSFKASSPGNRYRWCREGLWGHCTHPNYAGEWIFWLGTLSAGLEAVEADKNTHVLAKLLQIGIMLAGFGFTTATFRMNVLNMDHRLEEKYDTAFADFKQRYSTFGPRWWKHCSSIRCDLSTWWRYAKTSKLDHLFETLSNRKELLQASAMRISRVLSDKAKSFNAFSITKTFVTKDGSQLDKSEISDGRIEPETSTEDREKLTMCL
jgi:steroid 5-alpha reductase family enzyme